jgi:hypothetical protein
LNPKVTFHLPICLFHPTPMPFGIFGVARANVAFSFSFSA